MSAAPTRRITPAEYLELDRVASERFQYYQGEMLATAGGTKNHNQIIQNIAFGLRSVFQSLGRSCRTYITDLRVRVDANNFYTYPDVAVVCGKAEFLDKREDTLLNPVVVVEVLSPSTEHFDRGKKFELYRQLASLREYVLVSQHKPLVERFLRENDGSWKLNVAETIGDKLHLLSLHLQLPLSEIYLDVDFPPIVEDPPGELKAPPFDETNRPY